MTQNDVNGYVEATSPTTRLLIKTGLRDEITC